MTTAQSIIHKVLSLPAEKQEKVLRYAEQMERQSSRRPFRPLIDPKGAAAEVGGDLSLEDFQASRRELWGRGSDRELQ